MPRMPENMEEAFADAVEAALAGEHPSLPLLGELDDATVSRPGAVPEGIFRGRNAGGHGDRYVCARLGDGTWLSVVCDPARARNARLDPVGTWNATVAVGWPAPEGSGDDGFEEEVLLGYAELGRLVRDAIESIGELMPREAPAAKP